MGHCAVTLENGKVLILGGSKFLGLEKKVLLLDPVTNTFDDTLPLLNFDRRTAGCTVFYSDFHDGRQVVLSVGGAGQETAELYDYSKADAKWTPIDDMPVPQLDGLNSARAVNSPDGKGAIVQALDGLYQLDCDESRCS